MTVDTSPKLVAPRDRTRIDVEKASDVRWWSDRLNQSEAELRAAVVAAGPLSTDVLFYLNHKRECDRRPPRSAAAGAAPLVVRGDLRIAAVSDY